MVRNELKVFDADTHVRHDADLLEPFLTAESLRKLSRFDQYKERNKEGAATYLIGTRQYKRRLGTARESAPQNTEYMAGYHHGKPQNERIVLRGRTNEGAKAYGLQTRSEG
jgi:hypothetical protein